MSSCAHKQYVFLQESFHLTCAIAMSTIHSRFFTMSIIFTWRYNHSQALKLSVSHK